MTSSPSEYSSSSILGYLLYYCDLVRYQEQEAKIMIMRKRWRALEDEEELGEEDRAVKKLRSGEKGKEVQEVKIVTADGHTNFFSDLQTGVSPFM